MSGKSQRHSLLRYSSLGAEFTLTFLIPLAIGYWLDTKAGTVPGFMLLGGAIGFGVALWRLVRQGRESQRELAGEEEEEEDQPGEGSEDDDSQ